MTRNEKAPEREKQTLVVDHREQRPRSDHRDLRIVVRRSVSSSSSSSSSSTTYERQAQPQKADELRRRLIMVKHNHQVEADEKRYERQEADEKERKRDEKAQLREEREQREPNRSDRVVEEETEDDRSILHERTVRMEREDGTVHYKKVLVGFKRERRHKKGKDVLRMRKRDDVQRKEENQHHDQHQHTRQEMREKPDITRDLRASHRSREYPETTREYPNTLRKERKERRREEPVEYEEEVRRPELRPVRREVYDHQSMSSTDGEEAVRQKKRKVVYASDGVEVKKSRRVVEREGGRRRQEVQYVLEEVKSVRREKSPPPKLRPNGEAKVIVTKRRNEWDDSSHREPMDYPPESPKYVVVKKSKIKRG